MKKIIFSLAGLYLFGFQAFAQTFIQSYKDRADMVLQENINSNIQNLATFGIKTTGSTACNNAFAWLKNKYVSLGYSEAQIQEDPFTFYGGSSKNLIVTKTGVLYPDIFVIVCGHYDTIGGAGSNDNGSGVSVILEIARILKDIPTEYSIKFINFSGEEQGLYGSEHYVNNVVNGTNPKMNIKLVFNIDEVGGVAGQTNNKITCERDTSSPSSNNAASNAATQELINCVTLYSPLQTNLSYAYSSDYEPFQSNGEIITGFYEYNESPYTHSSSDTFAHLDPVYVFNVAKAAVGAVQNFAVVADNLQTAEYHQDNIKIYPNPAKDFIQIEFSENVKNFDVEILDFSGRRVMKTRNQTKIDVSNLPKGIYLGIFTTEKQKIVKNFLVK